jgi:acyl carrier protein
MRFFPSEGSAAARERAEAIAARILGIDEAAFLLDPSFWDGVGADSLDMAELVSELENEFD